MAKLGKTDQPTPLSSQKPLKGVGTWAPTANGYTLDTIQIGNDANNHGGDWIGADIKVLPGFALLGGTLEVSQGSITFQGTAEKPIILKNVQLHCEYTASVKASHTIFINCTFQKTGGYYWNGGYSSKWQFDDCMLENSSFRDFNRMDYGVKISRCTVIHCKIPQRHWGYRNSETPNDDANTVVHNEWSLFRDTDCYDCDIAPSAIWIMHGCNFFACRIGDPDGFISKTDLVTEVGLDTNSRLLDELRSKTTNQAAGKAVYKRAPSLFRRLVPNHFWKFAEEVAEAPLPPK